MPLNIRFTFASKNINGFLITIAINNSSWITDYNAMGNLERKLWLQLRLRFHEYQVFIKVLLQQWKEKVRRNCTRQLIVELSVALTGDDKTSSGTFWGIESSMKLNKFI